MIKGVIFDMYGVIIYLERISLKNSQIKVYDDALRLIRYLHDNNYKLAVASSASNADEIIKKLGLDEYFEFVLTGKDVKNNKPNPEIYTKALKKLNFSENDVIVIEDSVNGITASLKANIKTIGVKRGKKLPELENLILVKNLKLNNIIKEMLKDE